MPTVCGYYYLPRTDDRSRYSVHILFRYQLVGYFTNSQHRLNLFGCCFLTLINLVLSTSFHAKSFDRYYKKKKKTDFIDQKYNVTCSERAIFSFFMHIQFLFIFWNIAAFSRAGFTMFVTLIFKRKKKKQARTLYYQASAGAAPVTR